MRRHELTSAAPRAQARNRRRTVAALLVAALVSFLNADAFAQQFPPTLPANSVLGRLGIGPGPGQAIPFPTLFSNLTAGSQTFTGDVYFQSGRPWVDVRAAAYGAKGDGVTSDLTAFNAALTALEAIGGGILYVPTGTYCVPGFTVNFSSAIHIIGESKTNSILSACGSDSPTVTFTSANGSIERLTVLGLNSLTPSSTSSAIVLSNSAATTLRDLIVQFGYNGIDQNGANSFIEDVVVTAVYGNALIHIKNGGSFQNHVGLDQGYFGTTPAYGTSFSAWSGTTSVSLNQIVSITQNGVAYYIQCTQAGTTGSSQPSVLPYGGGVFADGTAQWHIVAPTGGTTGFYALWVDGGSVGVFSKHGDFTGAYTAGIGIVNVAGGNDPAVIDLDGPSSGDSLNAVILAKNGHDLYVRGGNLGGCVFTNCKGVEFASTWGGNGVVADALIAGTQTAVSLEGGSTYTVSNDTLMGESLSGTVGVNVSAGVSGFRIETPLGSNLANGALVTGVNVASGSSDLYEIRVSCVNITGTCVADNGTGTFKVVERNGSVTVSNASGSPGVGTVNVEGGYYINGTNITSATQTLTNKTLTSPIMTTPTLGVATGTSIELANGTANGVILNNSGGSADGGVIEGSGGTVFFKAGTANAVDLTDNSLNAIVSAQGASGSSWVQIKDSLVVGTTTISTVPTTGEVAIKKITATGVAPGAGFFKFEAVAGTNAGSCKIIAYAGTSTTPTTIVDNVGSGC